MLLQLENFLYRHRRKFLITGGLAAGLYFAGRYAEYKLFGWHNAETHKLIERQRKKEHYEKTNQTANTTGFSLSSSITKIVSDNFDNESLLQALRNEPSSKEHIWHQLKIIGFGRCIATVYVACLAGLSIKAHLMILGSHTLSDKLQAGDGGCPITVDLQHKYLENIEYFVDVGLKLLSDHILRATLCVVEKLPLDKKLTLEDLESLLRNISLVLSGELDMDHFGNNGDSLKLSPLSHYICNLTSHSTDSAEDSVLQTMLIETADVLDTDDSHVVMNTLISHGFNYILDYLADRYPEPDMGGTLDSSFGSSLDKSNASTSSLSDSYEAVERRTSEKLIAHKNIFTKSTLPVAKLIPLLSSVVYPGLSPAPGHLLDSTLRNNQLEKFGCNIYEAFA